MENTTPKSAVLLIHCPDQKGIVISITEFIFKNGGNILYLDQYVDTERQAFFMRIEWDLRDFVIVDEVDSLLLDKGQNLLYLSHSLPGMDYLEPVYVYIWSLIQNKKGSEEDIKLVQQYMLDYMYGAITESELCARFPHSGYIIWKELLQQQSDRLLPPPS